MKNREDALTSMFFGAFRREPSGRRILEFLNKAERILGSKPDFAKCCQVKYDDYEFWAAMVQPRHRFMRTGMSSSGLTGIKRSHCMS